MAAAAEGRRGDPARTLGGGRGARLTAAKLPPGGPRGLTAWERYGQVLLLANEFTVAD